MTQQFQSRCPPHGKENRSTQKCVPERVRMVTSSIIQSSRTVKSTQMPISGYTDQMWSTQTMGPCLAIKETVTHCSPAYDVLVKRPVRTRGPVPGAWGSRVRESEARECRRVAPLGWGFRKVRANECVWSGRWDRSKIDCGCGGTPGDHHKDHWTFEIGTLFRVWVVFQRSYQKHSLIETPISLEIKLMAWVLPQRRCVEKCGCWGRKWQKMSAEINESETKKKQWNMLNQ